MNKFDQNRDSLFFLLVLPILILGFFAVREASGYAQTAQSLTNFYHLAPGNPYVTDVNITQVAEEGIDIKLDQAILNHGQFLYSLLISGDLPENTVNINTGPTHCYFNGEELSNGGSGDIEWLDGETSTLILLNTLELSPQAEPLWSADAVTIKLEFPYLEIYYAAQKETNEYTPPLSYLIEGPWSFEFEVSGAPIAANTEIYWLSKTYVVQGETYTAEKLIITPINTRILMTSSAENLAIRYYSLSTDDGSKILMQFYTGLWETSRSTHSVIYLNAFCDPKDNWNRNVYELIQKSATLTLTPLLQNDPFAWPILVEDTTPLEPESVTVSRKQ